MEIWQHVNAWIFGPHDSNFQTHFQISFPNIFAFQAQHPQKMFYTPVEFDYLLSNVII